IGVGATLADLAVAPQGQAIVVWSSADGLWSNRFTQWGGWRTPEPIDDSTTAGRLKVGLDADGNAKLIWVRNNELWSSDYR
ncbi:MAG: hypothetical protein WCE62_02520, partial [Polyangiales bacterium]